MKRIAWFAFVILLTLTALLLMWQFRHVVGLFLLSLVVAAAARPPIDFLVRRRVSLSAAVLITYGLTLAALGALFFSNWNLLLVEVQRAADSVTVVYERVQTLWPAGSFIQQWAAQRLPPLTQVYQMVAGGQGGELASTVLGVTVSVADIVSKAALVLVLSIYWGIDRVHFERLWLSILPAGQRARARVVWRATENGVGAYLRSELIQCVLAGVLLGLGFWAMGVRYPILLALGGALAWLIPLLGAGLAIVPVFLVVAAANLVLGVGAAIYTALIFIILELVVEPRLFNRRRYNSILVIVTMIAMANALGIMGLLVAPPLAAAIQICARELAGRPAAASQTQKAPWVAYLEERLEAVHGMMAEMNGQAAPELQDLVTRLDNLVSEASDVLRADDRNAPREFARLMVAGEKTSVVPGAPHLPG